MKFDDLKDKTTDEIIETIHNKVVDEYEAKLKKIPQEIRDEFEKAISLNVIDKYWTENINALSHLREGVMMRGYGGEDPLRAYSVEGKNMYDAMLINIDKDITLFLLKAEIRQNVERQEVVKNKLTNDGDTTTKTRQAKSEKVGRNDPCPCGSGKKYKQCCGKK
jgi:preprotein translocase subunit SecA